VAAPSRFNPPRDLRRGLEDGRRRGLPFDAAWDAAWAEVHWSSDSKDRNSWKEALADARHEFRAAYEGIPTSFSRAARYITPVLLDAEPEDARAPALVA
jgi:hypothetical protein